MEAAVSPENYGKALKAVIANRGAPGIDGMKTEELNGHLSRNFSSDDPWSPVLCADLLRAEVPLVWEEGVNG